jgi:hypothetical protein
MSTNDDCYIGAYNLMEFKQSDVLNENAAKSIVFHSGIKPGLHQMTA